MRDVAIDQVRVRGALDVSTTGSGTRFHRLPPWAAAQAPDLLRIVAAMPSGVRLEFSTISSVVEVEALLTQFQIGEEPARPAFDLVVEGELVATERAGDRSLFVVEPPPGAAAPQGFVEGGPGIARFVDLPRGHKHCELWLPADADLSLVALRVEAGAEIRRPDRHAGRRWIHHGSSISHCLEAHSPTRTWPAIVARALDLDLVNLGFAGQCHLDPFVARTIRDERAEVISLEVGVNIVSQVTMTDRTFGPALHGFLDTIRDRHPRTPLVVISAIISPDLEDRPGPRVPVGDSVGDTRAGDGIAGAMTMPRSREIVQSVVEARRAAGDEHLHLVDGLDLFGPGDVGDMPDRLHPNGDGYVRIGHRATDLLRPLLA